MVITDWHDVEGVKAAVPDLLIPEHIPEGYKFQQLDVELLETGGSIYRYLFCNENKENLEAEVFSTASALNTVKIENSLFSPFVSRQTLKLQRSLRRGLNAE